ncbi:hypothetical protein [Longimicrobium sp.]|uniref:hypothetical protein n=1 Tax=Longimicrobium sp. TaxID=2029185 RepID=UPI002B685935|nr:hypothetical protein [Longimicrobium sp.]HSU16730.1 hypothetical protein [Longimicrobium sp.]
MKKILSAAVLLLAACSDPFSSGGVRVASEEDTYAVFRPDEAVTVRFTLTNTTSSTIQLPLCGSRFVAQVERLENGSWVLGEPILACPAVLQPPLEVAPDASVTDSVRVTGFGTWRVRVPYSRSGAEPRAAVSGAFQTRTPPD